MKCSRSALRLRDEVAIEAAIEYVASFAPKTPPMTVAGDAVRGRSLYVTCESCHGAKGEGNQALGAPALAARTDWYLVTQLQNYKAGLRGNDPRDTNGAQMRAIASTLPDSKPSTTSSPISIRCADKELEMPSYDSTRSRDCYRGDVVTPVQRRCS